MTQRFYNLKIGKPDVMGSVLKVDLSKPLEKRIADVTGENVQTDIKLLNRDGRNATYELRKPNGTFVNSGEGFAVHVETGRPTIIQIALNQEGVMIVAKNPADKKVYLSELTQKEALSQCEDARYFANLRDYVC